MNPETNVAERHNLTFAEAAPRWLESRKGFLHPNTIEDYAGRLRRLNSFFGGMTLDSISAQTIERYQTIQVSTHAADVVNHECSILQQVLKWAKLWHLIQPDYHSLLLTPQEKEGPGRALTEEEERHYFKAAFSNPRWAVAAHALRLSKNTSCGPSELRHLRLKDVALNPAEGCPKLFVQPQGAKNAHRVRSVPLNTVALEDALWLYAHAEKHGARLPEHYLIPFRRKDGTYDVSKPATRWFMQNVNKQIRKRTGINCRVYDQRHTAISLLLRNPNVSREHAKMIAGHIGERMFKRYFHGDVEQMAPAMEDLARRKGLRRQGDEQAQVDNISRQLIELLKRAASGAG